MYTARLEKKFYPESGVETKKVNLYLVTLLSQNTKYPLASNASCKIATIQKKRWTLYERKCVV